jgi:hypothetical protein
MSNLSQVANSSQQEWVKLSQQLGTERKKNRGQAINTLETRLKHLVAFKENIHARINEIFNG